MRFGEGMVGINKNKEAIKMAMASDIKRLGEDITASFDARVAFLGDLTKGTADMLAGFGERHREMAVGLRNTLNAFNSERLKEFNAFMGGLHDRQRQRQREVSEMKKETHNMLGGFRAELREMADSWRQMSRAMFERRSAVHR